MSVEKVAPYLLIGIFILLAIASTTAVPGQYLAGLGMYLTSDKSYLDTFNANVTPDTMIHHEASYTADYDQITRKLVIDLWGGSKVITSTGSLNSTTNLTITTGTSKLLLGVLNGTDVNGEIRITGTYINRTDSESYNTTEVITINGNATLLEEGLQYLNAYLTNYWWTNTITIWSNNTNITHLDVVQIAFDQFGEHPNVTVEEISVHTRKTNVDGGYNMSLYYVHDGDNRVNVTEVVKLTLPEGSGVVEGMERRKKNGGLIHELNGTHSGIFARFIPLPATQSYLANTNIILYYSMWETIMSRETTGGHS